MSRTYLFTSESVSEGHPDKIADQISDAVLDAIIAEDPKARVACETLIKTGVVVLAGEIATAAWVDFDQIVRDTVVGIGTCSGAEVDKFARFRLPPVPAMMVSAPASSAALNGGRCTSRNVPSEISTLL